jgi:hypothetical protein
MYVPVDATTAAWAAVMLPAAGPWRLVELGLIDFPYAARTGEEGQRHRAADGQQLGGPDHRHADRSAADAVVARAGAAETRGGEAAICPALKVDRPPRAVTARAVDVQLEAVPIDVADRLAGKPAEHGVIVTRGLIESPYVSSDSTIRHAGAQQCMQSPLRRLQHGAPIGGTTGVLWAPYV